MPTTALPAPQTLRRVMLRPGEVARRLGMSSKTVKDLGARGKIHREPDPSHKGYFLYDLVGARAFLRSRIVIDDEPTDEIEYEGQRLLWIDKLLHDPWQEKYHVSPQSLREWDEPDGAGCFTLDGERPGLVQLWFKNRPRPRLYVPIGFLDRYVKARDKENQHAIPAGGSPGPGRVWLEQAIDMGFNVEFLSRHSSYESPHRSRKRKKGPRSRPAPRPHPALDQRINKGFIRSGVAKIDNVVVEPDGTRTVVGPPWKPWFDESDLLAIKSAPPPDPKFWLDLGGVRRTGFTQSLRPYEGRKLRRLDGAELKTAWFWIPSRGRMVKHWRRAHIEKLVEDLPKPGDYVHVDPDGEKLVPVSRGAREAGVSAMDLFHAINKANPEWGGIVVRGRPIRVKLHKVAQDEPMFVYLADCIAVHKYLQRVVRASALALPPVNEQTPIGPSDTVAGGGSLLAGGDTEDSFPKFRGDGCRDLWLSDRNKFKPASDLNRGYFISDATIRMQSAEGKIRTVVVSKRKSLYYSPDVDRENGHRRRDSKT